MATSDRDILATALLTIKQHGGSAAYFAAGRADELLDAGAGRGDMASDRGSDGILAGA